MSLVIALLGAVCAWFAFGRPAYLTRRGTPPQPAPDLSVVIPARNEARTLPTLLASLARSVQAPTEVIVVDDGSTDTTVEVARALGATVVVAPPPPSGWLGKPWACHLGAQRASAAWLLFLDADVCLAPNAIAALHAQHRALAGGLLSVQPSHVPERAYEQLSAVFNLVGPMGTGAFGVMRADRLRTAFGPCLLTSAADYAAAGGHAAVRHEIVEDIALAARFDAARRPVAVLLGGALVSFRMYPDGLRSLADGWTKNIAAGATRAHRPSSIAAALWVATLSAVAFFALRAIAAWLFHGTPPWLDLAAWSVAALQMHVLLRFVGRFHPLTSVLFVVPVAFFVVVCVRSALCLALRRPVPWRGRGVRAGRVRA